MSLEDDDILVGEEDTVNQPDPIIHTAYRILKKTRTINHNSDIIVQIQGPKRNF